MGSLSLLQGIFPTQGSNWGLLYCRKILYQLSHQGGPRILEWDPIPSPADLPDPGMELGSPVLQEDSLPTELSGKPLFTFGNSFIYSSDTPLYLKKVSQNKTSHTNVLASQCI